MKRLLFVFLAFVLVLSVTPVVFAVDTPTITVGQCNIESGTTSANVTVSVAGFSEAVSGLKLEFELPNGLTIKNAILSEAASIAGFEIDNAGFANGIVSVNCDTDHMLTGVNVSDGELLTLEIGVASNVSGTLNISLSDNQSNYLNASYSNIGNVTVIAGSVTVGSPASTAYAVTLAGATTNDNPVRVNATNPLKVNVGVNQAYAAAEMTIAYPSNLVSFNESASTLGTAIVTDDGNGTLTLADYGADKNAVSANYVLAFNVGSTAGNAAFSVTKAGFGTGSSATSEDLTWITDTNNLGSVSIEIKQSMVTVTLPDDDLFYADPTTVEAGSDFTFYPEQTTGGYYDYTTPTATYEDGQKATVVAVTDENGNVTGWKIENIQGNVTISEGQRTPKEFGEVEYQGNANTVITGKTENAVYLTPITFTIPADVAAGTEKGIKYSVSATIGSVAYTLGTPTTDEYGNRTYTIPGGDVKGAVVITVTATETDETKVVVSVGGNGAGDGSFGGEASVQIDKTTGFATLTVDTTSDLNKGYNFTVTANKGTLTDNKDGTYTITGLTEDATITINKTVKVDGVKNQVQIDNQNKNFVSLKDGKQMWLIQLPNHVENTSTAVYKYDGKQMYWSADHNNYVIVVVTNDNTAPSIEANMFTLETVTSTPTIASGNWDVNKSGNLDANDAQLIWNMYNQVYQGISEEANGATEEKFILADANHDGVLDTNDAVMIINKILNITEAEG